MTCRNDVGIILDVEPATTTGTRLQVRVLGVLEAARDGSLLRLSGGRQRALLAVLAAAAGRVVTADALTDALWGDGLPADPPAALFNQVSRLRRVLGATLRTEPGGYRLDIDPDDVDAGTFERLLSAGRVEGDPGTAVTLLERAVRLWRGPAYDGLRGTERLRAEAVRLDDLRLSAAEALAGALLRSSRADEAASVARAVVVREPLREGLVAVLIRALALSGRQVEALDAYESYRATLADDTGLEPSAALRRFQLEVLRGDVADPAGHRSGPVRSSDRPHAARRAGRATPKVVGRDIELADLRRWAADPGTAVVFITGPAGMGKSALLEALSGAERVVALDGRDIEPTPPAFLDALDRALADAGIGRPRRDGGGDPRSPTVADVATRLDGAGPVVLAVDSVDQLLLLDSWWRTELLPALPATVTTLLAGRAAPTTAWWTAPAWRGLLRGVPLGPLPDEAVLALLDGAGVARRAAERIRRYARGHPLALHLAAAADQTRPGLHVDPGPPVEVADGLLRAILAETDPRTVATLEAACVLRRADEPLLAAVLGPDRAATAWRELAGLPFVEATPDGLRVQDLVRECVTRMLAARDPDRHEELRRRAAAHLGARVAGQTAPTWRTTADLLYLARHPAVRDAFFPHDDVRMAVDPAVPADEAALAEIIARHAPGEVGLLAQWWRHHPDAWVVARDDAGPAGFGICLDTAAIDPRIRSTDPVAAAVADDLRSRPLKPGDRTLTVRRQLSTGQASPSPADGAVIVDYKRHYLRLRPHLRRTYTTVEEPQRWLPLLAPLGFRPLREVAVPGGELTLAVLEFGEGSVDGWLARLVEAG